MSKLSKAFSAVHRVHVALEQREAEERAAERAREDEAAAAERASVVDETPLGPVEDQIDEVEAIHNIARLTEAAAGARDAQAVVSEVREVEERAVEYRALAEVINEETGGLSVESFAVLTLGLESLTKELGLPPIDLGIGMEDFKAKGQRVKISLEALDELIKSVRRGGRTLEKSSVEAINRLLTALGEALPAAQQRLASVTAQAAQRSGETIGGSVEVDDGLKQALSVGGEIPSDLPRYFRDYAEYGTALLCDFAPNALAAAIEASSLPASLRFDSADSFWTSVGEKLDKVGDPRSKLTDAQKALALPGLGVLFSQQCGEYESTTPALKAMSEFTNNCRPLDPIEITDEEEQAAAAEPAMEADGDEADLTIPSLDDVATPAAADDTAAAPPADATPPADDPLTTDPVVDAPVLDAAPIADVAPVPAGPATLQPADIKDIGKTLYAVFEKIDLPALAEKGKAAWPESIAAVVSMREVLAQTPVELRGPLGMEADLIPAYLDTVYTLSAWPVLHYLVNLVYTTNAFVLYAERSLAAPKDAPAPEPTPAEEVPAVVAEEPVAEAPIDTAAPAETVVEETGVAATDDAEGLAAASAAATVDEVPAAADTADSDLPPDIAEAVAAADGGDTVAEEPAADEAADHDGELAAINAGGNADEEEEEEEDEQK